MLADMQADRQAGRRKSGTSTTTIYIHTYIHTAIHTYIHTAMQPYIHIHMHIHIHIHNVCMYDTILNIKVIRIHFYFVFQHQKPSCSHGRSCTAAAARKHLAAWKKLHGCSKRKPLAAWKKLHGCSCKQTPSSMEEAARLQQENPSSSMVWKQYKPQSAALVWNGLVGGVHHGRSRQK